MCSIFCSISNVLFCSFSLATRRRSLTHQRKARCSAAAWFLHCYVGSRSDRDRWAAYSLSSGESRGWDSQHSNWRPPVADLFLVPLPESLPGAARSRRRWRQPEVQSGDCIFHVSFALFASRCHSSWFRTRSYRGWLRVAVSLRALMVAVLAFQG